MMSWKRKAARSAVWVAAGLAAGYVWSTDAAHASDTVKVAVVGGLEQCGVWRNLVPRLEAATGLNIQTIVAGPKENVVPSFKSGEADVLLIHGSDEALALLADGVAAPMRAWARNEHVIVGPADDPAGVAQARDGTEGLRRIAEAKAPFVAFRDPGSHSVVAGLMRRSGLLPSPAWIVPDESTGPHQILEFASRKKAYVVVGHIPVAFGKLHGENMKVLLKGDPRMRRVYVVLEPGPNHPAGPDARADAKKVADYLVSDGGQSDLRAADAEAGGPWIFTLVNSGPAGPAR
jgi:tungstate transport system substrate-binding protein